MKACTVPQYASELKEKQTFKNVVNCEFVRENTIMFIIYWTMFNMDV